MDNATASRFNLAPIQLEHMLILHTALGKDHFVTAVGEYGEHYFRADGYLCNFDIHGHI